MVCLLAFSPSEMEAVRSFPLWSDPKFTFTFVAAATMGSILNYSTFLCTINNSALTTTVIGCLKVRAHPTNRQQTRAHPLIHVHA